ncbi:uncharacterized protein LOC112170704 [Rosa chinensis]|uniref:uncharacterized protein LOC112170704 n=1 Tax=Rosa chinensis TaxID=74649 RepID=UPI001AD941AE|nr:uncharacterized protein LOC112170704 [Rosa chinensis]
MLALVDLPDWAKVIDAMDETEEGYEEWWAKVSVNCWSQRDDELFATIFGELKNPYTADIELLARFSEDAARSLPLQATQPVRAPRQAQAGIVIREPPQEGNVPPSGSRAVSASPATGQSEKQKIAAAALAHKCSRSDPLTDPWKEDEPIADRLVRLRSSRQTGEGSLAASEGTSASQAQAPLDSDNPPPPASIASDVQLASIPVQVIDDSSPKSEERMPLLDAPHEEPSVAHVLVQIVPDPIPGEEVQEPAPIAILYEPPAAENLGPVEEAAVAAEVLGANPANPAGEDMANQEPAPHVPEAGERMNFESGPEAAPVVEPHKAPATAAALDPLLEPPSRLERLARVLEMAPPGVIDEARDGFQRLLSSNILLPGASVRALE